MKRNPSIYPVSKPNIPTAYNGMSRTEADGKLGTTERHLPQNKALELWGKKCIPAGLAKPKTPTSKKVQPSAHEQQKREDKRSIQRNTHITCRIGMSGEYHAHFDVPGSETKLVPALKHTGAVVEIVVLCLSKR